MSTPSYFPSGVKAPFFIGGGGSSNKFAGMWTNGIWFVDGTLGLDSNDGTSPDRAVATVNRALTLAGIHDTIYIKPKINLVGWCDLDPRWASGFAETYVENITVGASNDSSKKQGISIIGTGNGYNVSGCPVQMKGVVGVNKPTIDMWANNINVENIQFGFAAAQTGYGVVRIKSGSLPDTDQGLAFGCTVNNCFFEQCTSNNAVFVIESSAGNLIEGCTFDTCRYAIIVSSNSSASDSNVIRGNHFTGLAASIGAGIVTGDCDDIFIIGNVFGYVAPTGYSPFCYFSSAGTCADGVFAFNIEGDSSTAIADHHALSGVKPMANFGRNGLLST